MSEPLILAMTSNTTPSGVVSASYVYPGRAAWWAFSGAEPNINSGFGYWYCQPAEGWLQYDFQKTITAEKVSLKTNGNPSNNDYTISIQSSEDGESFETVADFEFTAILNQFIEQEIDLDGTQMRYIRITANKNDFSFAKVQVWGNEV